MSTTVKNIIVDLQFRTNGESQSKALNDRLDETVDALSRARRGTGEWVESQRKLHAANTAAGKSIQDNTKHVSQFGNMVSSARQQLMQFAAVAGIGLGLNDAANTVINFNQSLADLSAITGATGGDLEFYQEQARKLGSTTTVSAAEAVEAFKLIGSAKPELLSAKEELVSMTAEAIKLSEASGIALPQAAEQLGLALNAMKLPASEAGKVVDVLAVAAQKGTREIPYVVDALSKFGATAASAGVSVQESASAIEILGAAIPDASTAGTNLRNILVILQTQAQKQGRTFQGLTKELELLKPRLKDITFLEKTFGRENILAAQTLISQTDAMKQFTVSLNETGAAQSQAKTRTETIGGELKKLKNAWDDLILSFSGSSNNISASIKFIRENLKTIVSIVLQLVKAWITYKVTVLAITSAQKAYNMVMSAYNLITSQADGKTKGFIGTFKSLNAAMKANIIGIVVTAILQLIDSLDLFTSAAERAAMVQARMDAAYGSNKIAIDNYKQYLDNRIALINKNFDRERQLLEAQGKSTVELEKRRTQEIERAYMDGLSRSTKARQVVASNIKKDTEFMKQSFNEIQDLEKEFAFEAQTSTLSVKAQSIQGKISRLKDERELAKERIAVNKRTLEELKRAEEKAKDDLGQIDHERTVAELENEHMIAEEKKKNKADQAARAGTIAELEERVAKLRKKLTQEMRLDAPEFASVVEQYIAAQHDLENANKRLEESMMGMNKNSIAYYEKVLSDLRKQLNESEIGSELFFSINKQIKQVEETLKEARKLLEGEDKRALLEKNLAYEEESERHEMRMWEIAEDSELKQIEMRLRYARERLRIMYESGVATEEELRKQENEITEIQAELYAKMSKKDEEEKEKRKKVWEDVLSGMDQVAQSVKELIDTIYQASIATLDKQRQAQSKRIEDAKKIAEEGNAEVLELEEKRLDELNKQREKFVRRQQALAAIELAINSAVAIAKAAAQGGVLAPFTIAATLAALATGLIKARAAASAASSFRKGGYTGDGHPDEESLALGRKPYTYHKGEFVMTHEATHTGNNRKIFDLVNRKRLDLEKLLLNPKILIAGGRKEEAKQDGSKDIVRAIRSIPQTSFYFDKNGIFKTVVKKSSYSDKIQSKL